MPIDIVFRVVEFKLPVWGLAQKKAGTALWVWPGRYPALCWWDCFSYRRDSMDPFKPYTPKTAHVGALPANAEEAEAVALQAVAFIAADGDMLVRFAGLTGVGLDAFRERLADPVFLAGVLDFIVGDEATLLAFVEALSLAPEVPLAARRRLPGGEDLES